ncbi:hypothetical protein BDN70DRAFT_127777 [Pholiota conissans]|uniref:GIY-YIG domain-containing protein n=1 Tax=Pholiota conissans TaxID=109636 RepID=A0A9P5ZBC0_9AGAR|nr:hypothetical protein BDN70DRAFT_127777 [Pholiota conissans]
MNGTTTSANPDPAPHTHSQPQHQGRPQAMLPIRQLGARSSILRHAIPSFYACYLLKSIQTPQSNAVYIGSTPSPPRRIRQHNGEISAGARKTQRKRPWVMQMIVHGFPSRLAALKFEWAWQHPHKSRHLRDATGNLFGQGSRLMKKNIAIVRAMIGKHPFDIWPLHVKLFTEEAVQCWDAAARFPDVLPLPPGFTCSVELEGVDGKSGHPGSGRIGPMAADDEEFTAALLAKNTALIASERPLECAVCHESLHNHVDEPLSTTLCPATGCTATLHLACLAEKFLKEETETQRMVPRGGKCPSCGNYTLWGDIVRGCFRRLPDTKYPDVASDDMFDDDDDDGKLSESSPKKHKHTASSGRTSTRRRKSRKLKGKAKAADSSEGESFDFDAVSSSSQSTSETPVKQNPGRSRLAGKSPAAATMLLDDTPKPRKKRKSTPAKASRSCSPKTQSKGKGEVSTLPVLSTDGESFDFSGISSGSSSDPAMSPKRKPGRPRKIVAFALDAPSPISLTKSKREYSSKVGKGKKMPKRSKDASTSSAKGEILDLTNITTSSGSDRPVPVKRKVGRPRKSDKSSSSEGEFFDFTGVDASSASDSSPSHKRKPGRPRKNLSLVGARTPLLQHEPRLPLHADKVSLPVRTYTSSPNTSSMLLAGPPHAENNSVIEILHHARGADHSVNDTLDERTLPYQTPKISKAAMSSLSISTPSPAVNKSQDKCGKDIEVIVLSD